MPDLNLSFACTPYDRVAPLISGEVKPDGITLEYFKAPGGVPRIFYDQMKFHRYDVSEMSMSSYLRMRSIGLPYRMLPVFHNRNFSYSYIHIRKGSGIRQDHPEDLKGKRIGIGDYQQTLGLWTRGILQMEWDVKPEDMIWFQSRGQHFSHTGASVEAGLAVPKNIQLNYTDSNFDTMFAKGELDAVTGLGLRGGRPGMGGYGAGARSSAGLERRGGGAQADIVTLFSDVPEEQARYFRKTGVYPPNHCTIVRESIIKEHPWVVLSLMEAFEESKQVAIERLNQQPPSLLVWGAHFLRDVDEVFGVDPFPYGIKANAKAIDMAQTFSVQQELTPKKQPLNEIFPAEAFYREEAL
jgi:4,5-dihydroxyphthalate decarboxylase